jgi:hypothetical protein
VEPVFEVRFICKSHLVYPPSSATGPSPETVQISGHGIAVRVGAPKGTLVVVHGIGFAVDARHPTREGDVVMASPLTVPEPQIRVWLDEPEQTSPGPVPVTLPTMIPGGQSEWFVLTAHTKKHDVQWRLGVEWSCGEERSWASCKVRTTAETGWVCHHSDGRVTDQANLHPEPDRPEVAAEAESNYRRAAESGDAEAMFQLGVKLAERGALAEAEQWFRTCAATGHATAAESVGWILEQNEDLTKAANWYRKAAELGSTSAAQYLARKPQASRRLRRLGRGPRRSRRRGRGAG